jgi:signal transduction histidine kinase
MTQSTSNTVEFLRKVPLFSDLSEDDLNRLCESVDKVALPAGEFLFKQDEVGDRAYIIIDGEVEILRHQDGRDVLLAVRGSEVVIGEMALVENRPRTASVRAREDTTFYAIWKDDLDNLLSTSPTAMQAMFHTILSRLRENREQIKQSERMAQLGTLTAGVAHELNNPAAAVKRGAVELQEALDTLEHDLEQLHHKGFNAEQEKVLHDLKDSARQRASEPLELDAIVRNDRESEIEAWLDEHGVKDAWQIAPNLVNLNFDLAQLEAIMEAFTADQLLFVIDILNDTYSVYFLINEVNLGASQISAIVKALKSYSYLDQAPMQMIDIHEGLDSTLLIMRNKLKQGISVKRDFAENLPRIMAYGSELNQVWTNLIDNAADALDAQEGAEITLRSRKEGNWIIVDVEDNGPGIPEENMNKVFDAFFTTKPPGKGTGMGLDITYRIVVEKHRGDIKLQSKPGETIFSVWLPITDEKTA